MDIGTRANRRRHPPRRCSGSSLMGGVLAPNSNTASKREGNTSMVRRPYYFRLCKKVPASNIESLPNELLSEILVRVPADDICENAMVVCRNWYHIIHSDAFVDAHRSNSDCGLLLISGGITHDHPLSLAVTRGRIEISYKLYRKCALPVPASCNGLALWRDSKSCTIYIVNLATKQTFSLPPSLRHQVNRGDVGIAYAAASMVYKVVRGYDGWLRGPEPQQPQCDILTVGVDNNWRSCIGVDNLSWGAKNLLPSVPVITEGFMHWKREGFKGTRVLTLNVETEMFTESFVPLCQKDDDDDQPLRGRRVYFLSTGRQNLSLVFARRYWKWEVWEMQAESGEWRELLPKIDLEGVLKYRFEQELAHRPYSFIAPIGWLKYPVLLALCLDDGLSKTCFVYNLHTDEIDSIKLPLACGTYNVLEHRNTLEWLS